jgi:hypothetical protein
MSTTIFYHLSSLASSERLKHTVSNANVLYSILQSDAELRAISTHALTMSATTVYKPLV